MSEKLTASRAPFGQKPPALRSDVLMVVVAALAGRDRLPAAVAVARATV
jgi:hypothetical protein